MSTDRQSGAGKNVLLDRAGTLDALQSEYGAFTSLLESLGPDEWNAQSLCSDWKARDVAAHIVSLDQATLTGSFFLGLLPGRDLQGVIDTGVAKWRDRDPADLIAGVRTWGRRQMRLLRVGAPLMWNLRLPTPLGSLRGRSLAGARLYDLWLHQRDIGAPLGRPEPDPSRVAPALQWMHDALGVMVGPALVAAGHRGRTIGFEIKGEASGFWLWRVGDSDAARTDGAPDADLSVRTDTVTYVVAGSGRVPPAEAAASGALTVEGDTTLGQDFLNNWLIV
jgi:uncharacterized protein (TIGR03083 family)